MSEENFEDDSNLNKISINFVESLFDFERNDKNSFIEKDKNNSMYEIKKSKKTKSTEKKKTINKNNIKNSKQINGPQNSHQHPHPQTSAKKIKNNNNINDSNNKNLFTEQPTKSDYLTKSVGKIEKHPKKAKKPDLKANNNNTTDKGTSTNEIYKAKQDSLKEKKLYEERVKILRNHINLLKKQEIELNKKAELTREKEKDKNKIKKEKYDRKQFLLSAEIDKRKALEEKKIIISQQKKQSDINLKESQERNKNKKINKYKQAYNDRKKAEEIRIEKNNIVEQKNHIQIEKIKNEREKNKERNIQKKYDNKNKMNKSYQLSYEETINQTQRLKDELSKLESMEDYYIENIKKTQEYIKNNNDDNNIKFSNYKKIKFNNKNNKYYQGNVRSRSTATSTKRRNKINNNIMNNHSREKIE